MDDLLAQWLARVEARALTWPHTRQLWVDYTRMGDGVAQYRLRITLLDDSLLQCVERVSALPGRRLRIDKYSFHWQHPDGALLRRWDNAPHHPEISSFPHHLHNGTEDNVLPHEAIDFFGVLGALEKVLAEQAA